MENWRNDLRKLVFVDVETTGLNNKKDQIIEIGIVTIKDGRVIDRYNQLINPGKKLDYRITQITGITDKDLETAPQLLEVKKEISSRLGSGVFVAHNAAFDYGFIENELGRVDIPFALPKICTVQLSKALYPGASSHSLDAISERFDIKISNRHRALDDALATWFFFQRVTDIFDDYALSLAFNQVYQTSSRPKTKVISQAQIGFM